MYHSPPAQLIFPSAFLYATRIDSLGQAVISNGMAWKSHLYLMVVSAKLLADTENMMQVWEMYQA
jgi:hypothetical protein